MKYVHMCASNNEVMVTGVVPKAQIEQELSAISMDRFLSANKDGHMPDYIKKDTETGLVTISDDEFEALVLHQNTLLTAEDALHLTKVADDFEFPPQTFRGAWRWDGKEISHDWEAAINIQLNEVRWNRDKLLAKYDGIQMQAMDLNDSKSLDAIKSKKQELRDCTAKLKELKPISIDDILNATPDLSNY